RKLSDSDGRLKGLLIHMATATMRARGGNLTVVATIALAAVGCLAWQARDGAAAVRDKPPSDDRTMRVGTLPALRLAPRPPVGEKEAVRIKALIAGLAGLDKADFGLSATLSGDAFAPLPGLAHAGVLLLTDHQIETNR